MSSFSDVKQSIPLTTDGLAQKYVNTTATNITGGRIMYVYGQATDADAEIKIYDEADGSKTASNLLLLNLEGARAKKRRKLDFDA